MFAFLRHWQSESIHLAAGGNRSTTMNVAGIISANGYSWSENPGQKPNPNPCKW
jgi:hypothetical protein